MNNQNVIIEEIVEFTPIVGNAVRHLVAQLDDGFQPLTDEDVNEMIKADNTHLFLARLAQDSAEIVGMFTLVVYRIPYKKKAWVEDLVVDRDFRRQGIAKKMLHIAIEEAKKLDIKSLNLTSSPTREYAGHIYQQLGFEKRDTSVYRISF